MPKASRVGDQVKLPSGRQVRVMCAAELGRPWVALEVGHLWHVCREHGVLDRPDLSHYFDGMRPLQLDQADAAALAEVLNKVRTAE